MSSRRRGTPRTNVFGPIGSNGVFPLKQGDPSSPYNAVLASKLGPYREECTETSHYLTPKPGGACKRISMILLTGSTSFMRPPKGVTFIFVQGKESACIVTRDLGKDKGQDKGKKIFDLQMDFLCMADPRLGICTTCIGGPVLKQPVELCPCAAVSALLNPDDLNEEKGSKPSSHKESISRRLNEAAAVEFLKQKLGDDGFKDTIQAAIVALQRLYEENVEADEIQVYTANVVEQTHKFLSRREIEMHLRLHQLQLGGSRLENAGV